MLKIKICYEAAGMTCCSKRIPKFFLGNRSNIPNCFLMHLSCSNPRGVRVLITYLQSGIPHMGPLYIRTALMWENHLKTGPEELRIYHEISGSPVCHPAGTAGQISAGCLWLWGKKKLALKILSVRTHNYLSFCKKMTKALKNVVHYKKLRVFGF